MQSNCNFGIYIHAKEPPKEKVKISQRSLNNLLSVEMIKGSNKEKDNSEQIFNRGIVGTIHRRGTLPISPSQANAFNNPFNVSFNSNQAVGSVLTNTRLRRKTVNQGLIGSI